MRRLKLFVLLLCQFISFRLFASGADSLVFIDEVKQFAFKEIGVALTGELYTKWSDQENPLIYMYVSLPDRIERPSDFTASFIYFGTDSTLARKREQAFQQSGYQTFYYKTFANASALLNKRLLSYPKEAIAFIVFHELIHNYLEQQKIKIPYEFNEALSDVIGNYGALLLSQFDPVVDSLSVKNQIKTNEEIYSSFNYFISKINKKPKQATRLNAKCDKKIKAILKKCNTFQNDRFNFKINNAYFLKNQYYSKQYFLLKKVLLKQKTIKAILDIMKNMPENVSDCEEYLLKFT